VQLVSETSVPAPETARLPPAAKSLPTSSTAPAFSNRTAPPSVAVEAASMAKAESATARPEIEPDEVAMLRLVIATDLPTTSTLYLRYCQLQNTFL
jgi:hypothetical protein